MQGYSFTEDLRKVLATAREEAIQLRHEYVGTEHILLAYTTPAESAAAQLLQRAGARPDEVRATIQQAIRPGLGATGTHQDLPYTSRAKKILELAMSETRERKHNYVGIENLLLGVIREEKGIAAQVLAQHGVTADAVRAQTPERPPPGDVAPEEWKSGFKVVGAPSDDVVWTVVRGGEGPRLNRGVVIGISVVWIALWVFLRPEILDWRLLGLMLLIVTPPIVLWRLTRR